MGTTKSEQYVKATETAFQLIESLRVEDGRTAVELAAEHDLSKSAVYNHLKTLEELGYVVHADGQYRLGLRFLNLGDFARNQTGLYDVARPEVEELVDITGERCQVMVEEANQGVYICQTAGDKGFHTDSNIGAPINLHSTAVGKAYLAHLPQERREELLDANEMEQHTDQTVVDRDDLMEELDRVRERGYGFNDEERILSMRAVGAPIKTEDGEPIGSLSVSGPTTRMNGDWFEEELPELVSRVARIIAIKATY